MSIDLRQYIPQAPAPKGPSHPSAPSQEVLDLGGVFGRHIQVDGSPDTKNQKNQTAAKDAPSSTDI